MGAAWQLKRHRSGSGKERAEMAKNGSNIHMSGGSGIRAGTLKNQECQDPRMTAKQSMTERVPKNGVPTFCPKERNEERNGVPAFGGMIERGIFSGN